MWVENGSQASKSEIFVLNQSHHCFQSLSTSQYPVRTYVFTCVGASSYISYTGTGTESALKPDSELVTRASSYKSEKLNGCWVSRKKERLTSFERNLHSRQWRQLLMKKQRNTLATKARERALMFHIHFLDEKVQLKHGNAVRICFPCWPLRVFWVSDHRDSVLFVDCSIKDERLETRTAKRRGWSQCLGKNKH